MGLSMWPVYCMCVTTATSPSVHGAQQAHRHDFLCGEPTHQVFNSVWVSTPRSPDHLLLSVTPIKRYNFCCLKAWVFMRKAEMRAVRTRCPRAAFPRPRHTDTWSQMTVEGCPVHWRVCSSTPGHYALNAGCDNKNGLQTLPMCPGEQTAPIEDPCPRPMSCQAKFLPPVGLKSTSI